MYKLRFLPVANRELEEITDYISLTLHAPQAALDFVDELERSLERICDHPYSIKTFQTPYELTLEYRQLLVKNFLVFYIVLEPERVVEVHRIIYGKRDIPNIVR